MLKGLQYALLLASAVSISLLGGKNIGLTKEIDNQRECVVCEVESRKENGSGLFEDETGITLGYTDSFWVDEKETVYFLEAYGKRVWEVTRKDAREIPLSEAVLPADIVSVQDKLVIFDDLLLELQIYTKQGELVARQTVPFKGDYVKQLLYREKEVCVLTYGGKWYRVNPETGELTLDKEKEVPSLVVGEYSYADYVDTDEDGTVYSINTTLVEKNSIIAGELTLRAVSGEGEVKGSYVLPVEEYIYLPDRYVQVHQNGNIYLMVPSEASVQVKKISLKESMESMFSGISKETKALEKKYASNAKYRVKMGLDCTETMSYSRSEVRQRAEAMAEYEWTLKKTHANSTKWEKDVVLPREIAAIKEDNADKKSWSEKVTGLPYCWGGFYALDTGFSGKTFQETLKDGYVAGNINPVGYYKYKSTGVDCSGFVGGAFGFTKKYNTSALSDLGSKVTDIRKLQEMDLLVHPGEHVIFFCEWIDEATMLVSESAVREGKVMVHPKSVNEFVISGMYQMRSPW